MKQTADKSVNALYKDIRNRYDDARANGYRLHRYFLKEQEIIISTLPKDPKYILDIGCGSGLMAFPLVGKTELLIGLDFNQQACITAKNILPNVIQGNAFKLPLNSNSINNAYCCQFLNQQSNENMKLLLSESYRVLSPNGSLILIWRNGDAVIHQVCHAFFKLYDRFNRQIPFPVIKHPIYSVENYAHSLGFKTMSKESIFPLLCWRTTHINSILSKLIGASYFLVLRKSN